MMGRLKQEVPRPSEGGNYPSIKLADKVGIHMHIRPNPKPNRDSPALDFSRKQIYARLNVRPRIVVHPRSDVRCTGDMLNPVRSGHSRHRQRRRQVWRAIVDAGKYMAVQVDQNGTWPKGKRTRNNWGATQCPAIRQQGCLFAIRLLADGQQKTKRNKDAGPRSNSHSRPHFRATCCGSCRKAVVIDLHTQATVLRHNPHAHRPLHAEAARFTHVDIGTSTLGGKNGRTFHQARTGSS